MAEGYFSAYLIILQRFPDLHHPRVFSRCSPTAELEVQTAAEHEIYGNAHRMGTAHGKPDKG